MSDRNIDIIPERRELEDGKIGYFYSPHQLEEIRERNDLLLTAEQFLALRGYKGVR